MKRGKRYTQEENEAIFRAVQDCTSLKTCFLALAEELDRSPGGIAHHWYTRLSNPESPDYMGTAMILLKHKRAGINRCNVEKFPVKINNSIWTRAVNMVRQWLGK